MFVTSELVSLLMRIVFLNGLSVVALRAASRDLECGAKGSKIG